MNYSARIKKLQAMLKELECDALLVDDAINIFYLTGMQLSAGILLVHAKDAHLLVDSRYFELCQKQSPVAVVLSEPNNSSLSKLLIEHSYIKKLGFSSDSTTYKAYLDLQNIVNTVLSAPASTRRLSLVPLLNPVKRLRSIKDAEEIELLRNAAALGSRGYDHVLTFLKEGISEIEVAIELEIFWKRRGSKGVAFEPIIAFGPNSSMPHYRAGNARLKLGDCVLIDIGVNCEHYHSDMTRMAYFGKPDPRIQEIHAIVKEAQRIALDLCRPGTLIGDLDNAARDYITKKGYGDHFTHSLGHGVGLEIHEWPTLRNAPPYKDLPLQPGMVITIEPGIYLPNIGGVRIEDTVVITKDGHENLTLRPT